MKKILKPTKTQKRLIAILTENTGRHFLDSGGAYGRNWERNQKRNFLSEPGVTVDCYNGSISGIYISLFRYLDKFLGVTAESEHLNKELKKALKKGYEADKYELEIMEDFVALMDNGEGYNTNINAVNTYNYETVLSQNIQYCTFQTDNGTFIALQVHGGCDARGGYTTPQIFEITGDMDYFIMAQQDINASSVEGDFSWDSSNGGYSFEEVEGGVQFKDAAVVVDNKVYNRINGSRIQFGSYMVDAWEVVKDEETYIPQLDELTKFVQENYLNPNVEQLTLEQFTEFAEESEIDLSGMIKNAMTAIESNTLELKFNK